MLINRFNPLIQKRALGFIWSVAWPFLKTIPCFSAPFAVTPNAAEVNFANTSPQADNLTSELAGQEDLQGED